MKTKKHERIIMAGTLLAFLVFMLLVFMQAGNWLVKKDELQKADAIVVLMGGFAEPFIRVNLSASRQVRGTSYYSRRTRSLIPANFANFR